MQPLVIELFLPFSHLLMMMIIMIMIMIVIMAATKAAGAAAISQDVAANSHLCTFPSWLFVLYSKSDMKLIQAFNRTYQNQLCSSLDLRFIFLI